ncbi:MAG: Integrase core domain-containing protein [Nitrospirae bacterium]|nr:MAG: Integrase core domain-containing protein [Nitrospirota bacterium]
MFLFLNWFCIVCTCWLQVFLVFLFPAKFHKRCGRRKPIEDNKFYHRQPKPVWVRQEVMRLKALMPEAGCRTIANTFNRKFAESKQMTVSKTFVNDVIRNNKYEIQVLRKEIKNKKPKDVPKNLVWGMDITGKGDSLGNIHNILGIVEHDSRLSLGLTSLKDKASITILRYLLDAVESYGTPKFVRTDNEPVFTSWLFRFSLWFIGIRHQLIDKSCPWQNGKIERLFGTLKEKIDQWQVTNQEQLNEALVQFRFWYNHVRPHQNLEGRTPGEAWRRIDVFTKGHKQEYWFEAWDGLLAGFYLKL